MAAIGVEAGSMAKEISVVALIHRRHHMARAKEIGPAAVWD